MPVTTAINAVKVGTTAASKLYLGSTQVWTAITYTVQDTFTDTGLTALDSHTPEIGGAITKNTAGGSGTAVISNSGRVRANTNSQTGVYYYAPTYTDVTVEADVHVMTNVTTEGSAICARVATAAATYYQLGYVSTANAWRLSKVVAGTTTSLGTTGSAPANGSDHHLKLVCAGTSITGYVDGVAIGPVTDSAIASGKVAQRVFGSSVGESVGHHYDNLVAY